MNTFHLRTFVLLGCALLSGPGPAAADDRLEDGTECRCVTPATAYASEGPATFFAKLFDTSDFPRRWNCGQWPADLGWLHIIADSSICLAYIAIPCILLYFARRRNDFPYTRVLFLIAVFILACGFGHFVEVLIFWWPVYRFAGLAKAFTAVISCITVVVLLKIIPRLVELPSTVRLAGELQETVQRFDCAIAAAKIAVWEWHIQEQRLQWDRRLTEMLHLPEGTTGAPVDEFLTYVHAADRTTLQLAAQKAIAGATPCEVRFRVQLSDGTVRHILAHGQLVVDAENRPDRVIGVCLDRTEEQLHKEQLTTSKDLYRATFEQAAMGIAHVAPDGSWLRMNRGLCEIVGYSADELKQISFQDITYPEDLNADLGLVRQLLAGKIDQYSLEKRYVHKQGHTVWANLSVSLIRDADGKPHYFVAVVEDIQERKASELVVRRMTRQFEQLLSSELLGIMTCRLDGSVEQANSELRRLLEWPQDQPLESMNWLELTPPERRADDEAVIASLQETGAARPWEKEFLRTDGQRVPVVMGLTPIDSNSGLCIGFVLDATRQKQIEEKLRAAKCAAEQASAAKSEFLATMSHELRTPLNGVIGMTQLLMRTPLNNNQLRYAQACHSSGQTLLSLISDILDLSKIEAGKLELEAQPFDLVAMLGEVAESNRPAIEESGLTFETKFRLPDALWVEGDRIRILRVLMNLLGNAAKFTSAGSIQLEAMLETLSEESATLRFCVADTGIGIAPERRHRLFEAFTQVDTSITRQYGGTGLGLAICKQLVTAMDGEIGVESELGEGSRFWFRLQIPRTAAEVSEPPGVLQSATRRLPGPDDQPRRVLIAEDNKINQMFASEYLRQYGWEIEVASTGVEAISVWERNDFDLILMDCRMPKMDGMTAAEEIRKRESERSSKGRVPIVALTANALKGDRELCLQAGMDDYLTKPFTPDSLLAVIDRVLDQKPTQPRRNDSSPVNRTGDEPIDLPRVLRQCGDDLGFAQLILTTFIETIQERLVAIKQTHQAGAEEELLEAAHALKGTSGQMGAWPLEAAAMELERALREQHTEQIDLLIDRLRNQAETCQQHVALIIRRIETGELHPA